MEQNYKNHRRYYPLFHFVLMPITIFCLGHSIAKFIHVTDVTNAMLVMAFLLILITAFTARTFALKAQDRGIRAEQNLRYFVLTGKLFPADLRLGQIIALRFAHDDEFIVLVDRAVKEQLSASDIKKAINNWSVDTHRV